MAGTLLVVTLALATGGGAAAAVSAALTRPVPSLLASAYQGGEFLRYQVRWLGIKAGELRLRVSRLPDPKEGFRIEMTARSAGLLAVFYPVEDRFITEVRGEMRLPVRYLEEQKEGHRRSRRLTLYDQQRFLVTYRKNQEPPVRYQLDGPAHNEFSAFLALRVLPLSSARPAMVPTFADGKRHRVQVFFEGREQVDCLFGRQWTLKVRPHLSFKGLYDKIGDPWIWLTDDPHRIPVRIRARIVIGSLVADLVEYQGPAGRWPQPVAPAPARPKPVGAEEDEGL